MKKLIILIALVGCQKKTTKPTQTTQTQTSKVWCIYQTNFGNKAFLYCAKSEDEYNSKMNQYQGMQLSTEIKTDCNECQ